jgi:large subunit ribosomal protein L10
MRLEQKKEVVSELAEKLERANIAITTSYRGLTVAQMTELRRKLRQEEIEYRVLKNNLARLAAEQAGREGLTSVVEGPTAVALGYGDVAKPAKTLLDYIRSTKIELGILGGLMGHKVLSTADVTALAALPPKEVLIARLLSGMQGSIYGLVNVLNANITGFLNLLEARKKQLEEGG